MIDQLPGDPGLPPGVTPRDIEGPPQSGPVCKRCGNYFDFGDPLGRLCSECIPLPPPGVTNRDIEGPAQSGPVCSRCGNAADGEVQDTRGRHWCLDCVRYSSVRLGIPGDECVPPPPEEPAAPVHTNAELAAMTRIRVVEFLQRWSEHADKLRAFLNDVQAERDRLLLEVARLRDGDPRGDAPSSEP